jgi:hypothetical protein
MLQIDTAGAQRNHHVEAFFHCELVDSGGKTMQSIQQLIV